MDNDVLAAKSFLASYFHQDYSDFSSSEEGVIDDFFAEELPLEKELAPIARGLRQFLQIQDDAELDERLFSELGCYFNPPAVGLTTRAWLEHVAELFEQEIARRQNTMVPGAKPQ